MATVWEVASATEAADVPYDSEPITAVLLGPTDVSVKAK